MKQRIDTAQLNELNDEQRQRLRDWWKPTYGDYYAYSKKNGKVSGTYLATDDRGVFDDPEADLTALPLLSIGQCFQYLAEHKSLPSYIDTDDWYFFRSYRDLEDHVYYIQQDELCDALWEAVKSCL